MGNTGVISSFAGAILFLIAAVIAMALGDIDGVRFGVALSLLMALHGRMEVLSMKVDRIMERE